MTYSFENFEETMGQFKIGSWKYLRGAKWRYVRTAPIIYSGIFAFVLLDLFVTIYQYTCFPSYGIPKVNRGKYFIFERTKLPYLNIIQKVHCAYCSYANGVIAYAREVASLTEAFWCPLKHNKHLEFEFHERYPKFADPDDEEAFNKKYLCPPVH